MHHPTNAPQFFLTAPSSCPYLQGKQERKVFTHLVGDRAPELNDLLTQGGFRRSQNIAYRPACENCRACISVRILAGEFEPSKNHKRILRRNADLKATMFDAEPTTEQYSLFRGYLDARHAQGGMSEMSVLDYAMMVEDTHVNSKIVEYRRPPAEHAQGDSGELVAVALTDQMGDGLSMVYSFFEPEEEKRSLGTFLILDHIERARRLGLPHIYLGYWVKGSQKMAYKARFHPQEHLTGNGWERFDGEA